jgi:hypoxanthine-guanine phosphoribosyltransferase
MKTNTSLLNVKNILKKIDKKLNNRDCLIVQDIINESKIVSINLGCK